MKLSYLKIIILLAGIIATFPFPEYANGMTPEMTNEGNSPACQSFDGINDAWSFPYESIPEECLTPIAGENDGDKNKIKSLFPTYTSGRHCPEKVTTGEDSSDLCRTSTPDSRIWLTNCIMQVYSYFKGARSIDTITRLDCRPNNNEHQVDMSWWQNYDGTDMIQNDPNEYWSKAMKDGDDKDFNVFEACIYALDTECFGKGIIGSEVEDLGGKPTVEPCARSKAMKKDDPRFDTCMFAWFDSWLSTYNNFKDGYDSGLINYACKVGCNTLKDRSKTKCGDFNSCLAECKKKPSVRDIGYYLRACDLTSQDLTAVSNSTKQALYRKTALGFAVLPQFKDFIKPIRGGFGCSDVGGTGTCSSTKLDINSYVNDVFTVGSAVFGGLAALKIIFAGVMYATAAGNPQRISEAKSHILYALLGIGLIILMNVLLTIIGAGPFQF